MSFRGKSRGVVFVLVLVFFAGNALALDPYILPHSDYYQGINFFPANDEGLSGHIEFAVYDTQKYENQFVGQDGYGDLVPWWTPEVRFIYAYQIFLYADSTENIDSISMFGLGEGSIERTDDVEPIGGVNDGYGGDVESDTSFFSPSNSDANEAVWWFNNASIKPSDRSWFLVMGSNHGMTEGGYTLNPPKENYSEPLPVPNPEPATLALLSMGGLALLKRRK
jgi:hypothetical protein